MEPRASERDFVIKVKYGDTLKRFSAHVHGEAIDHNMAILRKKIVTLFKLSSEADLILTYIDEDGDIVALDDDDELCDAAISQHLNPLRINICLKSNTSAVSNLNKENVSYAAAIPEQEENQSLEKNSIINEMLKPVPEPFRSSLSKFSTDFLPNIASSAPVVADIIDHIATLGIPNVSRSLNSSTGEPSEVPGQVTIQPEDLNINEESKILKISVPASTILSDPVSEQLHENLVCASQVDIDKTQASVHSPNLPVFEQASGNLSNHELLSETTDRRNQISNVGRHGKSVIAGHPLFVPPAQTGIQNENYNPSAQAGANVVTAMMDGHKNEQFPSVAAPAGTLDGFNFEGDKQQPSTAGLPFLNGARLIRQPNQRDDGLINNLLHTFHRGIRCDGCGMYPIVGPRFKSNVKDDYDFCSVCFSKMGNEADYTQIDKSHGFSHEMIQDSYRAHSRLRSSPHFPHLHGFGGPREKLESLFIKDVNVSDGTLIPPSTPFTKIWRMRNNGVTRWPYGTQLVWVGGYQFANRNSFLLEISFDGLPTEEEFDIAVDLVSPATPGRYISHWRLATPSGHKFGQEVWVFIQVDSSPWSFGSGLNLNLLPESSILGQTGIIDINADPSEGVSPESILGNISGKLVKPMITDETSKLDADPKINESPTPDVVPLSDPIIDLIASKDDHSQPLPLPTTPVDNTVEDTLLSELEEMGFKQIDLNKEVLRRNQYDLEQSIDELCDYAEWYPLLEELEDMGFTDRAKNKKLLIENAGSIKRVVLDLISGERA